MVVIRRQDMGIEIAMMDGGGPTIEIAPSMPEIHSLNMVKASRKQESW